MKNAYSFIANKDNTIVGCDSHLLSSEDEAYETANNLLGIFIDANNVEIFKYNNHKFIFFGSVQEKE